MFDWSYITNMIRRHYKPLSTVAKEVGSDWRHINRLARGEVSQPKFDVGVKLLDIFYDHVPGEVFERVKNEIR